MSGVLQESVSNVGRTLAEQPASEAIEAALLGKQGNAILHAVPPPEPSSAAKRSLESWFPLRKPLLRARAGTGRATSQRIFNLELRLPEQNAGACLEAEKEVRMLIPGLPSRRVEAQQEPEEQRMVGDVLLALLQEARVSRRARLAHRGGSGRAPTNRPLDVAFRLAPDPPTPYCPTPEAVVEVASLPCTPGTALRAAAQPTGLRSTTGRRSRSASFETPMEGVPERHGFVLPPKTPALAFTPMEGVPERMGAMMLPATCARRLPTTTPGPKRSRARAAADARLLVTPGNATDLASGDADHDSPVEGLLQPSTAAQAGAAPVGSSSSGSFAFSRAAAAPGQPRAEQPQQAAGNSLGFFGPNPDNTLHSSQGVVSLDSAPAPTPWRLHDYDPSPLVRPPQPQHQPAARRSSLGQPALASSLRPSPSNAANAAYDSDGDDDGFGGDGGGWGEAVGGEEDGAMEECTPAPEDGAAGGEAAAAQGARADRAGPSRGAQQLRLPVSCNKRLKREFRARKSLAGVGLQPLMGKRRSTRVSCKPLEWWRNERKVYERKFHSLPTVDHMEVYSTTPTWTFVSDYIRKPTARNK